MVDSYNPSSEPLSVLVGVLIVKSGVVEYMNPLCWINKSLYGNVVFNLNPSDPIFIASTSNSMAGVGQFKLI